MTKPPDDPAVEDDDAGLNELILAAFQRMEGPIRRPDDQTILAYLNGTASEVERAEVQEALIRSPALRSELLDLARDLDALSEEDAAERFLAVDVSPPIQPVLVGVSERARPFGSRMRDWLRGLAAWRRWAPIAVAGAAAVLLLLVLREGSAPVALAPGTLQLAAEQFAPIAMRGAEEEEPSPTAEEAAVRSFMNAIEYADGDFTFSPGASAGQGERPFRLEIVDRGGHRLASGAGGLPAGVSGAQLWLLSVPDLHLGSADLASDRLRIRWPGALQGRVYASVSYASTGGFRATAPVAIEKAEPGKPR